MSVFSLEQLYNKNNVNPTFQTLKWGFLSVYIAYTCYRNEANGLYCCTYVSVYL